MELLSVQFVVLAHEVLHGLCSLEIEVCGLVKLHVHTN